MLHILIFLDCLNAFVYFLNISNIYVLHPLYAWHYCIVSFGHPIQLTPMHYAAVYNHAEVVDLLLKNGGDVSKRDAMGRNVLDIAVDSNH